MDASEQRVADILSMLGLRNISGETETHPFSIHISDNDSRRAEIAFEETGHVAHRDCVSLAEAASWLLSRGGCPKNLDRIQKPHRIGLGFQHRAFRKMIKTSKPGPLTRLFICIIELSRITHLRPEGQACTRKNPQVPIR